MHGTINHNEPPEQTPQEQLAEELWLQKIHTKITKEEKKCKHLVNQKYSPKNKN